MKFNLSFIILILFAFTAQASTKTSDSNVIEFNGYKVEVFDRNSETREIAKVKITHKGKVVEEFEEYSINLSMAGYLTFMGEDGMKPYLVFNSWSGGAHCCAGITVYELAPQFKKSFALEIGNNVVMSQAAPDKDYYFQVVDSEFQYWHTSYAESAHILIELQRSKGKFKIIPKNKIVDEVEILSIAKSIYDNTSYWETIELSKNEPYYPGKLTEEVVNLIYLNKPELALKFIDIAWNPKNPYKEQFKKDLKEKLKSHTYWLQLEEKGYKLPF